MKFRKGSAYHLVSECNEYSISKVIVGNQVQYEAWYRPKAPLQPVALSVRQPSSLDCIGICRRHSEQSLKKTA